MTRQHGHSTEFPEPSHRSTSLSVIMVQETVGYARGHLLASQKVKCDQGVTAHQHLTVFEIEHTFARSVARCVDDLRSSRDVEAIAITERSSGGDVLRSKGARRNGVAENRAPDEGPPEVREETDRGKSRDSPRSREVVLMDEHGTPRSRRTRSAKPVWSA